MARSTRGLYALQLAILVVSMALAAGSVLGMTESAVAQREPTPGPPPASPVQPPAQAKALIDDPIVATFTRVVVPELTPEERTRALAIATSDPRLHSLLDGRQYAVDAIGPWTTFGYRQILGAGIRLVLAEPAVFDLDWPVVEYDETEATNPPYRLGTMNSAADNVRRLEIRVDLQHNRLVGIHPGPGSRTTRPPPPPARPARTLGR